MKKFLVLACSPLWALQSGWLSPAGSGAFGFISKGALYAPSSNDLDSSYAVLAQNPASDLNLRDPIVLGISQNRDWGYSQSTQLRSSWLKSKWSLGFGALYQTVSSYTPTDINGNSLGGDIQPYALDLNLRSSYKINDLWNLGSALHLSNEKLSNLEGDQSALGLAMDLGLIFQPNPQRMVSLSMKHLGWLLRPYQLGGETGRMYDTRFEVSSLWRSQSFPRWNLNLGAEGGFASESHILMGAEYRLSSWLRSGIKFPIFQSDLSELIHLAKERDPLVWQQDALIQHEIKLKFGPWLLAVQNRIHRASPWSSQFQLSYSWAKQKTQPIEIPMEQLKVQTMPRPEPQVKTPMDSASPTQPQVQETPPQPPLIQSTEEVLE